MKHQILVSALILLFATGLAGAVGFPGSRFSEFPHNSDYKEGELLVRFAGVDVGTQLLEGPTIIGPWRASAMRSVVSDYIVTGSFVHKGFGGIVPGLTLVKLPKGISVIDAVVRFNASANVLYAGPNYKYKLAVIPNDPRFGEQWGLDNTGQTFGLPDADIDAPEGWDIYTGSPDIIVAVIDSGIDYNHPDLADNIWINPGEVNEPGVVDANDVNDTDDDGNGYNDDFYGYDFVDNDNDPMDEHFHGTHVAGIIGAVGNNDEGIAGVCWTVKLMALRSFDANGVATTSDNIEAIEYAVSMGADVINASWTNDYYDMGLYDAISAVNDVGILFVAAAGNDGYGFALYPAAYDLDNIISVMATDDFDNMASFSNYSEYDVDLGAPGVGILSTSPEEESDYMEGDNISTDYAYSSGTSMAAPHVTGACALLQGYGPGFTAAEIKQLILRSVDPTLPGLCVSGGRLNLFTCLNMIRPGAVLIRRTSDRYPSIQEAINAAIDDDYLVVDSNHWYLETIDFIGKELTVRSGDVNDAPTFGVLSPQDTYISGIFDVNSVVTFNSGESSNSALLGFTITDGAEGIYIEDSSPQIGECYITMNTNGGVYCLNSFSEISDCVISENTAMWSGGGIYNENSDTNIINCTIIGNNAIGNVWGVWQGGDGGGIYCNNSDPNISGCTIADNSAQGQGGGIYYHNGSDPNIIDCIIIGNITAGQGGGIYCEGSLDTNITNCTISSNRTTWSGGGIYSVNCSPGIINCNIANNWSLWDGGGIYCDIGSEPNIIDSTISGNIADYRGGGIYCNGVSPLVQNCLILNNTVDSWDGGGIFCSDASPTITNCTIVGNSGGNIFDGVGGAVYCAGASEPVITNCIFSNNADIAIYEGDEESEPDVTFCLFHNNINGDYYDMDTDSIYDVNSINPDNILFVGGNISGDPMFVRGRLGNYYLSNYEAGQILDRNGQFVDPNVNPEDATSPAFDAGSVDAVLIGMHLYSTRTDNYEDPNGNKDPGRVDIGYHYNDPIRTLLYVLMTFVNPAGSGSLSPDPAIGHAVVQYSQVPLIASPNDPNIYQFKMWIGTDDDTRMDMTGTGGIAVVQRNIVTMDYHKSIGVVFETVCVTLRTRVIGGIGKVEPRGGAYPRGRLVQLTATPDNQSHRIKWNGSDDDYFTLRNNTVTMIAPFMMDPQGREYKEVEVLFYAPRTIDVPGDFTNLQDAIDNSNDGDIVVIAAADEPYLTVRGFQIVGKAVTITSTNPDDPNCVASTVIEMQSPGPSGRNSNAFYFSGVNVDTVLNGLTIRGFNLGGLNGSNGNPDRGYYDGIPGESMYGGAIVCDYYASPTIKNCVITDCSVTGGNGGNGAGGNGGDNDYGPGGHAAGGHGGWPGAAFGGGMACMFGSSPHIINCTFDNCYAIGGNGGGGGDGDGDPWGPGGRGGGWKYPYYPDPLFGEMPYEFGYPDFDFYTWYSGHGGAVWADDESSPIFENCTFSNNRSEGGGSGISGISPPNFREEPSISWKIDNFGGAVFLGHYQIEMLSGTPFYYPGYEPPKSEAKFIECMFIDNTAEPNVPQDNEDRYVSYGGAVAFVEGTRPYFGNCIFNSNLATTGGAMYWESSEPVVNDCNFVDNVGLRGGGVYLVGGSSEIRKSNFSGNEANGAVGAGGGIYCFDVNALIADCTLIDNDANGSGGGIYISGSEKVVVNHCLITGNIANRDGGGISANWNSEPNIINCTIAGNLVTGEGFESGYGGGLSCSYESFATVIDSIVWGNLADPADANSTGDQISVGTGFEFDQRPSTVTVSYSDIEGWRDVTRAGWVDSNAVFVDANCSLNWDFSSIIDNDPLFVDGYYLSQIAAGQIFDSPCVNAGSVSADDPEVGLGQYTTRIDGVGDADILDIGYHYVIDLLSLTVNVIGGNGVVDPNGTNRYNREVEVTLTARPDMRYRVEGWYDVNDTLISTGNTLDVLMDSDKIFTVQFEQYGTTEVSGGGNALQQAIDEAKGGETLIIAAGTYDGNINLGGKDITLVSSNPDDPNVVASTIIDCQQTGRGIIFNSEEDANTVVDGLTIINGSLTNEGGAGIFIDVNCSPIIKNVVISDCDVTGANGGGIYIDANSSPTFINCTITNCSADGGGGVFCDSNSMAIFDQCTFSDNSADIGGGMYYDVNSISNLIECVFSGNAAIQEGGGMFCDANGVITIADCNFAGNSANSGAGIYLDPNCTGIIIETALSNNAAGEGGGAIYLNDSNDLWVVDCNMVNNSAIRGGGLYCVNSVSTSIIGCVIQYNIAAVDATDPATIGYGGGIYAFSSPLLIRDCVITYNISNTSGGGVYLSGESDGSLEIANCLIVNNTAGRDGGGVSANWYAEPFISNCTFVRNAASGTYAEPNSTGFGGGLFCSYESNTMITDSIFRDNYALKGFELGVGSISEADSRCATLFVSYSDVKDLINGVWVDEGCALEWGKGNIDADPLFVTGPFGDFYLNQNSLCVDNGSDYAGLVGLIGYTTRIDELADTGIVDMGYHYPVAEPCKFCDLAYDGIINFQDFALLAERWLNEGCSASNLWCQGADITVDTRVDFRDIAFLADCWLAEDNIAPVPNPSRWETEPYWISGLISMTAERSIDAWGWDVEYYFECVHGDCHDSGWQSNPTYTDGGLGDSAEYGYRVKARDGVGNETRWSDVRYVSGVDTIAPTPAPSWIIEPYALSEISISMAATTAYDDNGVEYYFENASGNGNDSGWQDSTTYTDIGLDPNTEYSYRVKARDKSPAQNETGWSEIVTVTTLVPVDIDAPIPNPMEWDPTTDPNGFDGTPREILVDPNALLGYGYGATMTAVVAIDASGFVEYFFECTTRSSFSSGWIQTPTYTVLLGRGGQGHRFRVKVRDLYHNETAWSIEEVADLIP